jgi:hypothetical protein
VQPARCWRRDGDRATAPSIARRKPWQTSRDDPIERLAGRLRGRGPVAGPGRFPRLLPGALALSGQCAISEGALEPASGLTGWPASGSRCGAGPAQTRRRATDDCGVRSVLSSHDLRMGDAVRAFPGKLNQRTFRTGDLGSQGGAVVSVWSRSWPAAILLAIRRSAVH